MRARLAILVRPFLIASGNLLVYAALFFLVQTFASAIIPGAPFALTGVIAGIVVAASIAVRLGPND